MIELTPELVRKHRPLVESVLEAEARIPAQTRHSKKGKTFTVKAHTRHINVTHMGQKFKLRGDVHPEAHIQMLRKIAARGFNTADRVKARGLTGKEYGGIKGMKTYGDLAKSEQDRAFAAVDLMRYIYNSEPDLVSRRAGMTQTTKNVPSSGLDELKGHYNEMKKRRAQGK